MGVLPIFSALDISQMMKFRRVSLLTFVLFLPVTLTLTAASPEQEKAFVEAYRAAFEAKDEKALKSFLYTRGAHPLALEFYTMMITEGAGAKEAEITLENLKPGEAKAAASVQEGPDGAPVRMPLKPTKRLVIQVTTKNGVHTGTSTSQVFVAEADGKLVIPVPVPAK
jgi:hypothetical protein